MIFGIMFMLCPTFELKTMEKKILFGGIKGNKTIFSSRLMGPVQVKPGPKCGNVKKI
jgi:hypothetical protein